MKKLLILLAIVAVLLLPSCTAGEFGSALFGGVFGAVFTAFYFLLIGMGVL